MNVLIKGMESRPRVNLLLKLTKVTSDDVRAALIDHLSNGVDIDTAATINNVKQQNFNRALKRINNVAHTVEQIKEIDWVRFK